MKVNLLRNDFLMLVICAVSTMTALAEDEPPYEMPTEEDECKDARSDCVYRCDSAKRSRDASLPPMNSEGGIDEEAHQEFLDDSREEARFCRSNCDSDFNACMGRRPERVRYDY